MCTIPDGLRGRDGLYDRLASARTTPADGAALIALLELIASCARVAGSAAERVGPDPGRQASYQAGAWSALAGQYGDLIGGVPCQSGSAPH